MKTVSSLFFVISLLLLSSLSSCTQDDEVDSPNPDPSCRITRTYSTHPFQWPDSTLYQYDDQDRLLQSTWFYKGKEKGRGNYEYNSQGQLAKQTIKEMNADDQRQYTIEITEVITFEYNSKGQLAKYNSVKRGPSTISPNGYYQTSSESSCEYDTAGNRIRVTTTYDGKYSFVNEYVYQDGNCIKFTNNPGSQNEIVYTYEFDLNREDKLKSFNEAYNLLGQTPNKNLVTRNTITYPELNYNNLITTQDYTYEFDNQNNEVKSQVNFATSQNYKYSYTRSKKYECR
ncbi:hypothetical protein HUW51_00705 (plasmid) [Adhaeribacter swui]|uniref:RHS repeat protein n=1 Tax=Adhaeribacter swui TaxID=2086471 RepID=A0A7G7G2C7_9BACT|nr:hypothetical protein [Adhaeribacter swui]QNF31311.1 hypothetical protein HUW51_00705 [Adhaeribacter swui]